MRIDRQKALQSFQEYVSHYDIEKQMIRLKVEHTVRVAELCERIAVSLNLEQEDIDLAWLIGLLHDIGRFEQQKNYGTFNDAISIDHAQYGAELLFSNGDVGKNTVTGQNTVTEQTGERTFDIENQNISIRSFIEDSEEDDIIRTAIYWHSAYRVPQELDARTAMFCHILRDADKIDIWKVNVEFSLEEIYNVTTEELYNCQVTQEVMDAFEEEHAILRSLRKVAVDNIVGHISLVYELVYPVSLCIATEQGYLNQLMTFRSRNENTQRQFAYIRKKVREYCTGASQKGEE